MNVNLGKVMVMEIDKNTNEEKQVQKTVTGQVGRMRSTGFDLDITLEPVKNMSLTTGYIPKNTFYFLGDYTVPTGAVRGLGFNVSVSWQDKVYRNTANDSQFDGFWITDLGISYEIPRNHIRLGFNVNNLFNTDYFNQSLGNQFVPSEPTNWMASISYKF